MKHTDLSNRHRTQLSNGKPPAPARRRRRQYHSEQSFSRMLRRERAVEHSVLSPRDQLSEATAYLSKGILDRSVREAGLTDTQRQIFEDRASGCSWEQISERQGHSVQCAATLFRRAVKKIRRALRLNPLRGLAYVYRQEVSRFAPRGPKK